MLYIRYIFYLLYFIAQLYFTVYVSVQTCVMPLMNRNAFELNNTTTQK